MKANEIKVGSVYIARVGANITRVRVDEVVERYGRSLGFGLDGRSKGHANATGYLVTNLKTGRQVVLKSAAKFRREVVIKTKEQSNGQPSGEPRSDSVRSDSPETATDQGGDSGPSDGAEENGAEVESVSEESDVGVGEDSDGSGTVSEDSTPVVSSPSQSFAQAMRALTQESQPKFEHKPTEEQQIILDTAPQCGRVLVIEAGAGTGKTATLKMLSKVLRGRGQYTAFNSSLVAESKRKFGSEVSCNTTHSLAFRAVGKDYEHRLGGARMKSEIVARILDLQEFSFPFQGGMKRLAPGFLAGQVLGAIRRFCQSADREVSVDHFKYIDGIDLPTDGGRTYGNNERVREYLLPYARAAWTDLSSVDGHLPFSHDCQPPWTMVRRVNQYGGGISGEGVYEDVKISDIRRGDRVVSLTMNQRRGYVRRAGRLVTAVGSRPFNSVLITVKTDTGKESAYTPNHKCVARLDCDLTDGNYVVYVAQRDKQFRIGRTTWRTESQDNSLGIRRRADCMDIDAIWVLGVYTTNEAAATAEAITGYQFHIPTVQFPWRRAHGKRQITALEEFWSFVSDNYENGVECLRYFGRSVDQPMFSRDTGWKNTRRPLVIHANNLLSGMLVLDVDAIKPGAKNELWANDGNNGWRPCVVSRQQYSGPVFSLDVDEDHTYIADGIATHNCYVKIWQLSSPVISADYILLDEDQDTAPVMLDVLMQQEALLILVGDDNQQIYEWRGSVSAAKAFPNAPKLYLTQSFRFGEAIAEVANAVLAELDEPTDLRLRGLPSIPSRVCEIEDPTCILCRTNAVAVSNLLKAISLGRKPFLVGGGTEVVAFMNGAKDLQNGHPTSHPELACFSNWAEVEEYSTLDEGEDLKLMVKLIKEFGCDTIIGALKAMVKEEDADLTISTAHKSKGREWDKVQLASDFPTKSKCNDAAIKLLYVGTTRAKIELDISQCPFFTGQDALDITKAVNIQPAEGQPVQPTVIPAAPSAQPGQYTWGKHSSGKWCIRGPKGGTLGQRVEVFRKNGSSSRECLGFLVQEFNESALYQVGSK